MARDRVVAVALLLPFAAGIAFSCVRLLATADDVPDASDDRAARAVLDAAHINADDAVAILPPWSVRPLQVLHDLHPISGDALAERPLQRHARLFVVAEPGADAFLAPVVARLGPPASSTTAGRDVVHAWTLPRTSGFDLSAHVADAQVRIDDAGGSTTTCDEPLRNAWGGGWRCPGRPDWLRVDREYALVSENGDLVVWSHPPPPGQRVVVTWPSVALGRSLVVRAGHTRRGADGADRVRGVVRLHVLVDDVEVAVVQRAPSFAIEPSRASLRAAFVGPADARGQGFRTDVVDTARFAGTTHRVAFAIETDDDSSNHFAWDAFVDREATR